MKECKIITSTTQAKHNSSNKVGFIKYNMSNQTVNTSSIVSKVWAFCNTLRDDGVGYGDYLEQLTYLLFLKMADEYSKPPHNRIMAIPSLITGKHLSIKVAMICKCIATTCSE
jgi:hypothetical protein